MFVLERELLEMSDLEGAGDDLSFFLDLNVEGCAENILTSVYRLLGTGLFPGHRS